MSERRCCSRRLSASLRCRPLLLATKLIPQRRLYESPKTNEPPPFWIRCLLILTCTGVSFAHGSNDGQKGMGLIMLILIGTVPTAYALNRTPSAGDLPTFVRNSLAASKVVEEKAAGYDILGDPRPAVTNSLLFYKIYE